MVVQLSPSTRGWVPCLLASQDIEVHTLLLTQCVIAICMLLD